MSNNFHRYNFENPQDDPDDLPSDWYSSGEYEDEYDRYEDYVTETGHDPYGLFDDVGQRSTINHIKSRLVALKHELRHIWKWHTSAKYRQGIDEIPF